MTRTGSDVVGCATELLDGSELLGGEGVGDVELDAILEDRIRKLGRIRRGIGLEEELSRHMRTGRMRPDGMRPSRMGSGWVKLQ